MVYPNIPRSLNFPRVHRTLLPGRVNEPVLRKGPVRVLKIAMFEGSGFLGQDCFGKDTWMKKNWLWWNLPMSRSVLGGFSRVGKEQHIFVQVASKKNALTIETSQTPTFWDTPLKTNMTGWQIFHFQWKIHLHSWWIFQPVILVFAGCKVKTSQQPSGELPEVPPPTAKLHLSTLRDFSAKHLVGKAVLAQRWSGIVLQQEETHANIQNKMLLNLDISSTTLVARADRVTPKPHTTEKVRKLDNNTYNKQQISRMLGDLHECR